MNNKIKIAFIVGAFPLASETFIYNQIKYLKSQGHKIDIYALRETLKSENINIEVSISHKVFSWDKLIPGFFVDRILLYGKLLLKRILYAFPDFLDGDFVRFSGYSLFKFYYYNYFEIKGYDVIHVHFGDNAVAINEQLKNFTGLKVVTFHGYDAHNYNQAFYKPLLDIKDLIITVNTHFTLSKLKHLGFTSNTTVLLPMSVDTRQFRPDWENQTQGNLRVIFVGRFVPFKAPLLAIKIIERLITEENIDVKLIMIGDGIEFHKCAEYIRERNLNSSITLSGTCSSKEVEIQMNKSDVFLFPGVRDNKGRCENQGLVIQEAQSMELPVLISNVGGMKEGILDGESGYIIPENDISGFVIKLKLLYENPEKRKAMGRRGRSFVQSNYDINVLGKKLVNIYTV